MEILGDYARSLENKVIEPDSDKSIEIKEFKKEIINSINKKEYDIYFEFLVEDDETMDIDQNYILLKNDLIEFCKHHNIYIDYIKHVVKPSDPYVLYIDIHIDLMKPYDNTHYVKKHFSK